jgi:hypothetical protein
MRRATLLLIAAFVGLASGLVTSFGLVPRVRLVEVLTVFFTAFGAGATLVGAVLEFRKARRPGTGLQPPGRGRPS